MAKAKILVVEDESIIAENIQMSLYNLGYTVSSTVSSGEEAVKKAEENKPDLVLMDIILKGKMDGIEAAKQIYSRFNIPVVYLTAHGDDNTLKRAKITDSFGYILKPFEERELHVIIEMALFKHRKEKELEASKASFYNIVEKNADGIIIVDQNGVVRFLNPAAESILGRKAKEIFGHSFGFPVVANESTEIEIIRRDEEPATAEMRVVETVWENERAFLASLRDITELKRLEKTKDEFISIVSHELRTPLSIIKESISLVLDKVLGEINEKQNNILTISKNNIDRLARLINDLLDMSRIEAGKVELRKKRVVVANLIEAVASTFESKVKEKGLELRIKFPRDGIDIYADEDKITQVLTILVDNAIKFTSQGYIEASVQEKEDAVECAVVDTGVGIPKEDLPKTFDKFKQFGRKDGPGERGTGLGLSIAKSIVEMHKGKIWVESEVGEGTKFIFSLPKLSQEEIFKEYLSEAIKEAKEKGSYFSAIMISILNLKELIQESHKKAKTTIKIVEEVIKNSLRSTDILVADTGEILVILPEVKRDGAMGVLKRIEQKLKRYFSAQKDFMGKIDINSGVISFPDEAREEEEILNKIRKRKNG